MIAFLNAKEEDGTPLQRTEIGTKRRHFEMSYAESDEEVGDGVGDISISSAMSTDENLELQRLRRALTERNKDVDG